MSSDNEGERSPEGERGRQQDTKKRHGRGFWNMDNTKVWVQMFVEQRMSAVAIAKAVGADPDTVSTYLKKHGIALYPGLHRVEREPPKVSVEAPQQPAGTDGPLRFLDERIWGADVSAHGMEQLSKYIEFLRLPLSMGTNEVAEKLDIDKTMVKAWTEGTKLPYLVKLADVALHTTLKPGWKLLPLRLESGGNTQGPWIQVPTQIQSYDDIRAVISQLTPLDSAYQRARAFGLEKVDELREDLFSYLLGIMGGDASKAGGKQKRFTSSNIDLHLTLKQPTNERMGEFVCICANSLGIVMDRKRDKQPTGSTRFSRHPSAAYRWTSQRSPLIAWMFNVGLGLEWDECTTLHQLRMDWIFSTPPSFRTRFVQGLADSDGTVKPSEVVITSVPNADFLTRLLQSLGMTTAHTITEAGKPLRTMVNRRQSAKLPIFSEFVKSYRYNKLMEHI